MAEILDKLIAKYGEKYLICDCRHPLITNGKLSEEAALYNLSGKAIDSAIILFDRLTGKKITPDIQVETLSGGQKVLLLVSLALISKAKNVLFFDLERSLDLDRRLMIKDLLKQNMPDKDFVLLEDI